MQLSIPEQSTLHWLTDESYLYPLTQAEQEITSLQEMQFSMQIKLHLSLDESVENPFTHYKHTPDEHISQLVILQTQ